MKRVRQGKKPYRASRFAGYPKREEDVLPEAGGWRGFAAGGRTAEEERHRLAESFREMGIGQV